MAFDSQVSACPAAAPEELEVAEEEAALVLDEEPGDVAEELFDELELVAEEPAVAPVLSEVGVEAALQVPAVLAAQQAALPLLSVPQ